MTGRVEKDINIVESCYLEQSENGGWRVIGCNRGKMTGEIEPELAAVSTTEDLLSWLETALAK